MSAFANAADRDEAAVEGLPMLQVGDRVADREQPDATLLVVGHAFEVAHSVAIDEERTVADANPGYPANDWVVEVVFPSRGDADVDGLTRYAYPRSRLQRTVPFHERAAGQEGDR